ncbi:hypothetical protein ACFV6F_18200 [Kitasatospora phosalacinea]|uniref:hypothetical protein n=1 Tax=Kitasatospora phosalacinea TaxID=2065 RepID=UPI003655E106
MSAAAAPRTAAPGHPAAAAVRLSSVVMAHPRRARAAEQLAARLGPDVRPVFDPDPDGPPSALRTALRAWEHCPGGVSHHAVFQDDVLPADDAPGLLREALARHPGTLLTCYANSISWNGAAARAALLAGHTWLPPVPDDYLPTLAVAMPCAAAHEFVRYARDSRESDDDEVLARFLRETGLPALLRAPSLVEHDDLPSLSGYDEDPVAHPDQYRVVRRSVCFSGAEPAGARPEPLTRLAAWPHFVQRRALLRMPSRLGRSRWQTRTRTSQLRVLGLAPGEHHATADAALERLDRLPEPRAGARRLLRELALTAVGLGAVVAAARPGPPARGPLTDAAVSTCIEAGLGKKADVARWQDQWPVLLDLAWSGIALGAERGIAAEPGRWT